MRKDSLLLNTKNENLARLLSYVVATVLVLLPAHALLTTWLGSNFGHLDLFRIWKEIVIALIALPCTWLAWRSDSLRADLTSSWLVRLCGLYFLLHFTLGLYARASGQVNSSALIYALLINLRFIGLFLICYVLSRYSSFLKASWKAILLVPAALVIVFGLAQIYLLPFNFLNHFGYGPNTIPAYQTVDSNLDYRRIQSTLRGANPLGAYLVLIIPAFLMLRRRAYRYLGLAGSFVILFYTYSRSAWLGTIAALSTLAFWYIDISRHAKKIMAIVVAVVLLAGVTIYAERGNSSTQDTLFHISSSSSTTSPNELRTAAINQGISDITHQPLGRGPGTAGPASFRNTGHPARIAENYYLQIGQEVGLLGMGLFITINIMIGLELWRRRDDQLCQVLFASLLGISLICLVSHAWTDDTLSLLWWGLAGIGLASTKISNRTKSLI